MRTPGAGLVNGDRWYAPSMDLYNDLEELRGMTHVLIDDVNLLRPKLGEGNPDPSNEEKANRRFYVRAVFALVEAFVEQHRRLLVHLCEFGRSRCRRIG